MSSALLASAMLIEPGPDRVHVLLRLAGGVAVELLAAPVRVHDDQLGAPQLRLVDRLAQCGVALRLRHVAHHDGPHRLSSSRVGPRSRLARINPSERVAGGVQMGKDIGLEDSYGF